MLAAHPARILAAFAAGAIALCTLGHCLAPPKETR